MQLRQPAFGARVGKGSYKRELKQEALVNFLCLRFLLCVLVPREVLRNYPYKARFTFIPVNFQRPPPYCCFCA